MKALRNRGVWLKLVGVSVLLTLVYLAYLAPLISPEGNLQNLPVALVNEDGDRGLGARVVHDVQTHPTDAVRWTLLENRDQALRGIADNGYYGAVVIPADYSERIAALAAPGTAPKEPANIEVLTNSEAGPSANRAAQEVALRLVEDISESTTGQLVARLSRAGVQVAPQHAPLLAEPVRPTVTEAAPVGANSAGGLTPFYLTFLAAISGLMGAGAIHFGLTRAASRLGLFSARLLLGLVLAPTLAALETWAAVGVLGMEHEASALAVFGLLALVVYTSMAVVLLLVTNLGPVGLAFGAVFNIVLGQITSGGATPLQALPASYRLLADWLPFRYATDATRALLFRDGGLTPDVLASALWALCAYLALAVLAGLAVALAQDLRRHLLAGSGNRAKAPEESIGKEVCNRP
jgi:YhgE/Pip-like protein